MFVPLLCFSCLDHRSKLVLQYLLCGRRPSGRPSCGQRIDSTTRDTVAGGRAHDRGRVKSCTAAIGNFDVAPPIVMLVEAFHQVGADVTIGLRASRHPIPVDS